MFLKFTLLFLFFIMVVSCMNTDPLKASNSAEPEEKTQAELDKDDTAIEKAFANCLKWANLKLRSVNECISKNAYYMYMGDNREVWDFITSYFGEHAPKDPENESYIGLPLFRDLFKKHCKKSGKPVDALAEEREAAVKYEDAIVEKADSETENQGKYFVYDYKNNIIKRD